MKLSVAMMLGSVTCKMVAGDINTCAIGCAGNAVGVPQMFDFDGQPSTERYWKIAEVWPWILESIVPGEVSVDKGYLIWSRFDKKVCKGKMTFEQLVDFVRSIEPDCGQCNRFDCTCVQKIDDAAQTETTTSACI